MKDDFKRISISSNDYEFSDSSVESFGCLVGPLFDLFEGSTLRDEVIDG